MAGCACPGLISSKLISWKACYTFDALCFPVQELSMSAYRSIYTEKIEQEIHSTPDEYLPLLLEMVRLFRQSVALKPATESFRQGWQEARAGETMPVSELWNHLDPACLDFDLFD
jgi:hypothetical protein